METILRDLQEECRRLRKEAAKKIEEKYVGKGAVILSGVHELDRSSRKARLKYYTILKPNKINSDTLTFQSDSWFGIKIYLYANCDNEPSGNKVIIVPRYRKCESESPYNDSIRFVDERIIDELLKEIKSLIPSDSVVLGPSPFDHDAKRIKHESGALQLKEGESVISLSQYLSQLKKELEDYLNEGL